MKGCEIDEFFSDEYLIRSRKEEGSKLVLEVTRKTDEKKLVIEVDYLKESFNEYRILKHLTGISGIPVMFNYGKNSTFHYKVTKKIGVRIQKLLIHKKLKIPLLSFGKRALQLLENIHIEGILHRSISPEAFYYNRKTKKVFLSNFRHAREKKFPPNTPECNTNLVFASVNNHLKSSHREIDDIESLGYLMIYLYEKYLPWENEPKERIGFIKANFSTSMLCYECPLGVKELLDYCRGFSDEEEVDYEKLYSFISNRKKIKYEKSGKKSKDFKKKRSEMIGRSFTVVNENEESKILETEIAEPPILKNRAMIERCKLDSEKKCVMF